MVRAMAVLLTIMFAGCAGDAPQTMGDLVDAPAPVALKHNVTFAATDSFRAETFTGAFEPEDNALVQNLAAAAGQASTASQIHDVTDLFVVGAPTWVSIQVVAPAAGGVFATLSSPSFTSIWTSDCDGCTNGAGTLWEGAAIRGSEDLLLNVFYVGGAPEGTDYEVTVATASTPAWIPSGISIGVMLTEANTSIRFQGAGGPVPDVMVFGPDDALVTTLPGGVATTFVLAPTAARGEYVFHPMGHGKLYALTAQGPANVPVARLMAQEIRSEGPHPAVQAFEMTFEAERQPLQMGLLYFGRASFEAVVTLTAPSGQEVVVGHDGFAAPIAAFAQTQMGDPGLGAGTYTLAWTDTVNDGSMQVQEFITFYGR